MAKKTVKFPPPRDPLAVVPFSVNGVAISRANVDSDPLNIDVRTYIRIHAILEKIENGSDYDGEKLSIREEIAALALIERLRPKDTTTNVVSGSSVRKYEDAFKSAAQRKKIARPSDRAEGGSTDGTGDKLEPDSDWFENGGDGGAEDLLR